MVKLRGKSTREKKPEGGNVSGATLHTLVQVIGGKKRMGQLGIKSIQGGWAMKDGEISAK